MRVKDFKFTPAGKITLVERWGCPIQLLLVPKKMAAKGFSHYNQSGSTGHPFGAVLAATSRKENWCHSRGTDARALVVLGEGHWGHEGFVGICLCFDRWGLGQAPG